MPSQLSRAWEALTRHPALALIPVCWELFGFLLSWLTGSAEVARSGDRWFHIKLLLPQALPSGGELIARQGQGISVQLPQGALAVWILMTVASAFVAAGYLHLLTGALREAPPSAARFREGAIAFGPRLLIWRLLVLSVLFAAAVLFPPPVALLFFLFTLIFFLTEFLVVAEDLPLVEAIRQAPGRLVQDLGRIGPALLASLGVSAVLSLLLTGLGLRTILLASPLWGWFGTWVTMALLAGLLPPPPADEGEPPVSAEADL